MHVLEEAAGQSYAAPGSHGLGYLLFAELIKFRTFLFRVYGVDKRLTHLFQELVNKDAFHLGADLGLVAALGVRVFGIILQGMERAQARGPQGSGR